MYRDPKVKLRKDVPLKEGLVFAALVLLALAALQTVALYLYL
ncbi:MAG: hypothetical protein MAG715_00392 [Methanonatronarchaeales archaeon]|nr:hypothetical protein [Methanonatronarchaeales archaeon]